MSGADVLRALRARRIATPVVLMSGFGEEHVRRELAGLEAQGFLQKPFRFDELLATLGRAIAGS
jgi:two-component system cell cycle response regulator CtrA